MQELNCYIWERQFPPRDGKPAQFRVIRVLSEGSREDALKVYRTKVSQAIRDQFSESPIEFTPGIRGDAIVAKALLDRYTAAEKEEGSLQKHYRLTPELMLLVISEYHIPPPRKVISLAEILRNKVKKQQEP